MRKFSRVTLLFVLALVVIWIVVISILIEKDPALAFLNPIEFGKSIDTPHKTWYGTYNQEAEDCFKYGGIWGGNSTHKSCSDGTGAPLNSDGTCPDGYLKVKNSWLYVRYDGDYSCHKKEYVEKATCEKYWELGWSRQGYSCSRLSDDERVVLQNEEILENQQKILELLGEK